MSAVVKPERALLKLDLGCGPKPRDGFIGVDAIDFGNAEIVKHDLRVTPWPFSDNSVVEANCSHFLEHLTNLDDKWERVHFFNELWRIMVPVEYNAGGAPAKGFCRLVIPHWASNRYYGDPTHKEPFGEMAICYLDPDWRKANAPHTDIQHNPNGYNCHWACSYEYSLHQDLNGRNAEYVRWALTFFKDAALDLILTMSAIKK